VFTAAGLVLAFGGLAMRNQRKELVLERELALEAARRARDERLERASRAAVMGTLAMGVAHEISTPLGVIAARAEQVAAKVDGDERLRVSVQAILSQIDRIKQVIGGLLGLARGDAPSAERIEPARVIDEAVGLTEHRFGKSRVRLRREVDANLPAVLGDPRLLEHAVVNLLLNACDASRPDGEVTVRARRVDADVEIAVEDAGAGISPADVGRALEPFFTTKPRGEGHGLGLAVAQEIVSSHRGTLALAPRAPRGTRAAIRLPPAEGVVRG
jgi:signal transduction histidine kinase